MLDAIEGLIRRRSKVVKAEKHYDVTMTESRIEGLVDAYNENVKEAKKGKKENINGMVFGYGLYTIREQVNKMALTLAQRGEAIESPTCQFLPEGKAHELEWASKRLIIYANEGNREKIVKYTNIIAEITREN